MDCPCVACRAGGLLQSHQRFTASEFTTVSPQGLLTVFLKEISVGEGKVRFKVNKAHSYTQGAAVTLPTVTLDDTFKAELYTDSGMLLGAKELELGELDFTGSDITIQLESELIDDAFLIISLEYAPYTLQTVTGYGLWRATYLTYSVARYTLEIDAADFSQEYLINDKASHFTSRTWHFLALLPEFDTLNVTLKETKTTDTGRTKEATKHIEVERASVSRFLQVPSPNVSLDAPLSFWLVPLSNEFQARPVCKLAIEFPPGFNHALSSFSPKAQLKLRVVSKVVNESAPTEEVIPMAELIEDIEDGRELELMTLDAADKLVLHYQEQKAGDWDLKYVGVLKFQELPGLVLGASYTTVVQLGPEAIVLRLTFNPVATEEKPPATELEALGIGKVAGELNYVNKTFFNILDLLEFKTSRVLKKVSLLQAYDRKLKTQGEQLTKRLYEIEHAEDQSEFKNIVDKSRLKKRRQPQKKPVEESTTLNICGCGNLNPKFKGYCETCVRNLREDYEKLLKWFSPIETQHDNLENKIKTADARRILLERKVKKLEERLTRPIEIDESLSQIRELAELKAQLSKLEAESQQLRDLTELESEQLESQEAALQQTLAEQALREAKLKKELEEAEAAKALMDEELDKVSDRLTEKKLFNQKNSRYGRGLVS